jgi:putative transposase
MPRPPRKAPGGVIFHVLNRGVGRRGIFEKPEDYAAFERVRALSAETGAQVVIFRKR